MLTQIKLSNFKIFQTETTFPLKKINLLTGINGRGKSTLLQTLILLKQSVLYRENTNQIILNGDYLDLGTFSDIKHFQNPQETPIEISLSLQGKEEAQSELSYILGKDADDKALKINQVSMQSTLPFFNREGFTSKQIIIQSTGETYEEHWIEANKNIPLPSSIGALQRFFVHNLEVSKDKKKPASALFSHFRNMHYVSADRIGPQKFYEKFNLDNFIETGKRGEKTLNVLAYKEEYQIHEKLRIGQDAYTLKEQTGKWLSQILDTSNINIKPEDKANDYIITLDFLIGEQQEQAFKPSNVGFGFSYILPIIVSGLIAKEGEILIIENPEAHLHPKAQSALTKFLAKVASTGVQVFLESHSEHVLNALRVAVVLDEYEVNHEDINVLYFTNLAENNYFEQVIIEEDGGISDWHEGFFDQRSNDFDILFSLKSK
jgi:predicted ATPase